MTKIRQAALIFSGGALGSCLRWGLQTLFVEQVVMTTVAVNIVGSGLLGVLVGLLEIRDAASVRPLMAFLGTGVLGGFTTYSAFALQVTDQSTGDATLIALVSVLGGVVAAAVGLRLSRRGAVSGGDRSH